MKNNEITKRPDMGIFDKQFPVRLVDAPIDDPTKFTILTGDDGILDDLFSYQVYNKLKNHWRAAGEAADKQPGMIWSDSDDDKLYHYGNIVAAGWEEILQVTRSIDKSPYFANLNLAEWIYHTGDTNTYVRLQTDHISFAAGAVVFLNMVEAGAASYLQLLAGKNFIGDDVNTKMTIGLTINQAGNDDEILAFKSSDVAHGVTDATETDTFASVEKQTADQGGLKIRGVHEGAYGVNLLAIYTAEIGASDTKGTAGVAPMMFDIYKKDGTGIGNIGANQNILAIRAYVGDALISRWILDEDGDTWQDGEITCAALSSLVLGAPPELTINGGSITVTRSYHRIDGAGDAADDLDTINGGVDGMILILQSEHNDRDITITQNGNIDLNVAGNFVLTTHHDKIMLIYNAITTYWEEISRSDNLA